MATEELGLEIAIEGFRTFLRQMGQADDAIDETGKRWGGLGTAASKAGTSLTNAGGVLAGAVVAGAVAAAAALASVVVVIAKVAIDSTKLAIDFQSQMAVLGIAASGAGESFDELHDAALKVGADTTLVGVSATGAADSLTGLYKAGLTTTEIFGDLDGYMEDTVELSGALRAAIDLAAASELDMVQASDLAAIALATFGSELETEEERATFVNMAMNNMVQAADASVASVSGLAAALTNVGPVAAQFGFSIEDTNNALAILSTRGIEGSEAGTALRSMMTNIMRPTDAVKESLTELGVSLYDMEGNMLSLPEIIGQFETALAGVTDEQRNQYIQTLAGTFGMKAFNTLISEGTEGWDDMAAATKKAAGTQVIAAAKAATFAGKMEALDGTIETLKIGIGEAFLPTATDLITWFTGMADKYGPQLQAVFEAIGAFLQENLPIAVARLSDLWNNTFLPALIAVGAYVQGTVLPTLTELGTAFGIVAEKITGLWAVAEPYIMAAAEWIANHVQLKDVLIGLGIVIASAVLPALAVLLVSVLAIAAPIVAVIAAVALLRTAWEGDFLGMRTAITDFWDNKVKPAFETVKEWLAIHIPLAIETLRAWWEDTLLPALEAGKLWIEQNLVPVFEAMAEWLKTNIPNAITILGGIWDGVLLPALQGLWAFIQDNLTPILVILAGIVLAQVVPAFVAWAAATVVAMLPIVALGLALIALGLIWDEYGEQVKVIVEQLGVVIIYALNEVSQTAKEMAIIVVYALNEVSQTAKEMAIIILYYVNEIATGLQEFIDTGIAGWKSAWEDLKIIIDTIWTEIGEFIATGLAGWETAWNSLTTAYEIVKAAVLDPLITTFEAIGTAIGGVIGWVSDLIEKLTWLRLPDFSIFQPGSPTPFEIGLQGIAETMEGLTRREIPRLAASLQALRLPEQMASIRVEAAGLARGTVGVGAAGGTGGGSRSVVNETVNNFNLTTQSVTRPGALAMEFNAMSLATR